MLIPFFILLPSTPKIFPSVIKSLSFHRFEFKSEITCVLIEDSADFLKLQSLNSVLLF